LADRPGAVIDGNVADSISSRFVDAWRESVAAALDAVGWGDADVSVRSYTGGVTVFHSAPIDALYAATEVNEWAWRAAETKVGASAAHEPLESAVPRLRRLIEEERNPGLLALQASAEKRGVSFLWDDDHASVGTGTGSRTWPTDDLPGPEEITWDEIHDVPRVLVTGTNGKTTTVRMVAAIAEAGGLTAGFSCTDGVYIGGEVADAGDWSGPGGARAVLRDRRVQVAILETARGGMLRRGLAVDRADGALVTNVAADHLGEWGVLTVDDVATAKLVVAKAVAHGAPMVVNADDTHLARIARTLDRPLTWIAQDESAKVREHIGPSDVAWVVDDGWLVRLEGAQATRVVDAADIPATMNAAAAYNVSNALGAAALAEALGFPIEAIRSGLTGFDGTPERNPGRGNLFEVGGIQVLVDFVHNSHGFEALARTVARLAAKRVGITIGHAGDRDDESIRELARAAWAIQPERVAIKELGDYLRGREFGEVPAVIHDELSRSGAPEAAISEHPNEVEATLALLEWAQEGDFLLISTQTQRTDVLDLIEFLEEEGWTAGAEFPQR
jgi:UDP-N-acetylmuramyl tripeptide synthase